MRRSVKTRLGCRGGRREGRWSGLIAGILGLAAWALLGAGAARAWEVRGDAPRPDLERFHRHLSGAAFHFPRHGAAPLGWTGFQLYVDATYNAELGDESFVGTAISGDLPADVLSLARVGVRKGLPGRIDVGAAYSRALGSDLELLSADLQWAWLRGGAILPALSLRLTASESAGDPSYHLQQYGVEVLVSKTFALVTPYLGIGLIRGDGRFSSRGRDFTVAETQEVLYAGVTLDFLLPRITVAAEQSETFQIAIGVGFGF